jgi:LDH2 family malate/lactate/ureidoglycolate dehydrogenase
MATSTVAIGKLKVAAMHRKPIPSGWALDDRGRPLNDPFEALKYRRMTPLGGAREMGGHKGYGLAAMVEILSTMLGGASYAPTRPRDAPTLNVGHFFLTLDPGLFREREEFMADLDDMLDALHAAPPVDPDQPVLVHGDPEAQCAAERSAHGIPLQPDQIELMRTLAQASGAAFVLVS